MVCKKCGAEYPETETKCPFCENEEVAETETLSEATEETVKSEEPETVKEAEAEESVQEECAEENVLSEDETAAVAAPAKSKAGLWAIIALAVFILAAAAAVFGISSNLYYTSANDENASVFVITKKEHDKVYAKVGDKEAYLVKELGDNETFSQNSEFVVKNNNLYFLNDEGGISIMNMKNGKTREIGYDFKAGTLVISAKGDTILYVGEDGVLYKSTKGRQAKEIADVGGVSFENTLPNYGFVEGTNTAWYAPVDEAYSMTSVYLESGDSIADKVSSVFYVGDNGLTVVYSTVTDEQIIEQEPVEPAEGEEPVELDPVVVREYALMIKEEGKDPAVLNEKYEQTDSVSILHKERKGVLYLTDKGEAPTDPESGMLIGTATGTLCFHEFNGETTAIDTEVSVALLLDELNGSNYWYDASDRAEDETIAYMKNSTIALIKDLKIIENPAEFEFLSSSPGFAENNTLMFYTTYNPKPVEETTEDAEEATEETKEPSKFVYTRLVDGAWTDYTLIAEDVVDYNYDEDDGNLYYLVDENDDMNKLVLYCFNIESGEKVKVADDALGYIAADKDGKDVYYVNAYNPETQLASISYYNNKGSQLVAENLSGCMITEDGTPFIVIPDGENTDLYCVSDGKISLVVEKMTNVIYGR